MLLSKSKSSVLNAVLVSGLTLSLAALAAAQTEVIRPIKRVVGPRAVAESTYSVFPQIDERMILRAVRPENPTPQWWRRPDEEPNTLPVGGLLNEPRGVVTAKFPGIGFNGSLPPDPNFAVGQGHIVQVVNTAIAFFTKTGTKLFQQTITGPGGFFGSVGAGGFVFDPKAFYDPISQRYFVVALDVNFTAGSEFSKVLVAVSDDANPAGTWYKYRLESKINVNGVDTWLDYPGWAGNKDAIVCTGNQFTWGSAFRSASVIVISKAPMLSGGAPTVTTFLDNGFTIQPARTGDVAADRIYAASELNNNRLKLYAITNLLSSPVITTTTLTVPSFSSSPGNAPSTGGNVLDTLPFRILNAYYRQGKMVCAHSVARQQGSSDTMVRWYEINMNNWPGGGVPALAQSGNVAGAAGQSLFMPAVNKNSLGDISLIFTRSSSSITADVMFTGRKVTDPLGSMGVPQRLVSSQSNYAQYRWGDYFDLAVDPLDDTRFWGAAMIAKGGVWESTIDTWLISQPGSGGGSGTNVEPTSIVLFQGAGSSGDVNSVKLSDSLFFDVTSAPETGLGQIAAAELSFTLPDETVNGLAAKFDLASAAGTTGMVWMYNWNANRYDNIKAFAVKSGSAATLVPIGNFARYISSTREVKMVLRGLMPQRRGSMPAGFTFRSDQILLVMN